MVLCCPLKVRILEYKILQKIQLLLQVSLTLHSEMFNQIMLHELGPLCRVLYFIYCYIHIFRIWPTWEKSVENLTFTEIWSNEYVIRTCKRRERFCQIDKLRKKCGYQLNEDNDKEHKARELYEIIKAERKTYINWYNKLIWSVMIQLLDQIDLNDLMVYIVVACGFSVCWDSNAQRLISNPVS